MKNNCFKSASVFLLEEKSIWIKTKYSTNVSSYTYLVICFTRKIRNKNIWENAH